MGVDENVSTKEQLKQLMAVKDKLEAQISAYGEVLVQVGIMPQVLFPYVLHYT